jgi:multidrug transporter EmrE-like cation transporter
MSSRAKNYLGIHLFLMLYSTGAIFSKLAGRNELFSLPFLLLYGVQILILFLYAVGWQQFIKRMPLSAAYANKAVTVVWGCIWGILIFQEHISAGKLIGGILVLAGVALYGYADGKMADKSDVGMLENSEGELADNYDVGMSDKSDVEIGRNSKEVGDE